MRYPHQGYLSKEIFGQECRFIDATLANHLDRLLAVLPPGHTVTAQKIIREQTLFPFYQPFVSPERGQRMAKKMYQTTPNNRHQQTSLPQRKIPEPKRLHFCYDCLIADRQQYGEGYWHRLHQASGVKVCPTHGTMLQESQVAIYYRPPTQRYLSAEQALVQARPAPNSFPPAIQQPLLQLARDAAWLLQHNNDHITPASLLVRFRRVLVDLNLAPYQGRLYTTKFLNRFKPHYFPELLDLLGCPLDYDDCRAWPFLTVNKKSTEAKHPLQHLLTIRALGYSVETFFALPTETAYFGQGPWPCLNPVGDHYRQAVIETYQLDHHKLNRQPQAIFACQICGFTYQRLGPDTSPEDCYRIDRIINRGSVWENRLAQLRADPTIGPTEIARQLNTNPTTVTTYQIIPVQNQPDPQAQRKQYRAIWLETLQRFPEAKVNELCRLPEVSSAYRWLIRHDREWYKAHTRDGRKTRRLSTDAFQRQSTKFNRYWHTRDAYLAQEVRLTAQHLLSQPGKPQKLTKSAICYHLNLGSFLPRPDRYPITAQTLNFIIEPQELFVIRRLLWAANDYGQQDYSPTRTELIRHAGLMTFFYGSRHKVLGQTILDRLDSANLEDRNAPLYTLLPSIQHDWPDLDARLAEAVVQSAHRLKHNAGYPTRVTVSTIGLELEQLEALLRYLEMLPQTAQTLAKVVETETELAHRVLVWVIANDPDTDRCENRADFVKLSGLQPYDNLPVVTKIIDEAFEQLQAQKTPTARTKKSVDWTTRDEILAPAVRQAAKALKAQPEIKITAKAISQILDQAQLLNISTHQPLLFRANQLPKTNQALQEVLETSEQFTQRRLYQLAEQFRQQGLRPTKTQLRAIVNARTLTTSSLIQQTINDISTSSTHLPSTFEASLQAWWAEIDAELAPLIEPAARHLKAQTDPFVSASKSAIATYLGQYSRILPNLDKLPQTAAILAQVAETREVFALRRVQWWEEYYRDRKIRPKKWQLIQDASVTKMMHWASIQTAIAEALQTLSSFPTE
jgi:hypothetical protein